MLADVLRRLPGSIPGGCRLHLCMSVPLNPATSKVDRRALEAQLDLRRKDQLSHSQQQDEDEQRHTRFYGAWTRFCLLVLCAPQMVFSLISAVQIRFDEWPTGGLRVLSTWPRIS